ncbi:MAG: GYD domain-containing protein [Candidatus Omnitrophica bacterium]|nr:GYD domain-containing protein [Candidatus Omnitrophota bacterium]
MQTFFMMGKYSSENIRNASPDRTEKAIGLINELGGEVVSIYALLGGYDLVLIVKLSDLSVAMKVSLGLSVLTQISFSTYPALAVDDFDRIIGNID